MLLALALTLLGAQAAPATVDVVVHDGKVDVSARDAPLAQILDQVAAAIGTEVEYEGPPPQQVVTLTLVDQAPTEVFLGVLRDQGVDFALQTEASGGGVARLFIAAESTAPDVPPPPPPEPELEPPESPLPETLQTLLDQMRKGLDDPAAEGEEVDEGEGDGEPEPPPLPEALRELLDGLPLPAGDPDGPGG